ncbi:hypothetical protein Runsl_1248 [Runella slithyformis DSM 19594]|uniref:Uncharacterized protein n=1 Tax=Runella slithyformis (strain ATCC 29530 / DSM 19594 / LMG 11500 / NCIMB 11436 / LSU 4) TaxID=761193 RepID=A0A7U3ZI81_RUNSL|nr:hypothetical protein Runsl_1248 [Runella slithyformis DSM 19594]
MKKNRIGWLITILFITATGLTIWSNILNIRSYLKK